MNYYADKLIKYAGYFVINLDLEDFLKYTEKTLEKIVTEYKETKNSNLKQKYQDLEILYYSLYKLGVKQDFKIKENQILYHYSNEQNEKIKKIYNNLLENIGLTFINYGRTEKVEIISNFIDNINLVYNIIPNNNYYYDKKIKLKRLFVIFKNFEQNIINNGIKYLYT